MASGPPRNLEEGDLGAQKTLLIRIEDCHEGYFRQVETLSKEVYAHQDVEFAEAQIAQNPNTLQSTYVRVKVSDLRLQGVQILTKIFGHPLCKGSNEGALLPRGPGANFVYEVVHLGLRRANLHSGVY